MHLFRRSSPSTPSAVPLRPSLHAPSSPSSSDFSDAKNTPSPDASGPIPMMAATTTTATTPTLLAPSVDSASPSSSFRVPSGLGITRRKKGTRGPDDGLPVRRILEPEYGKVITRAAILDRVVQFYELFISNALLLGFEGVSADGPYSLFKACPPSEDLNCRTKLLHIFLILFPPCFMCLYSTIVSGWTFIYCLRTGFYARFTLLYHSIFMPFCLFFPEHLRVDVTDVDPVECWWCCFCICVGGRLRMSGRVRENIVVFLYCFTMVCVIIRIASYGVGTRETIEDIYNIHIAPYYLLIFIYLKGLLVAAYHIWDGSTNWNKEELVGVLPSELRRRRRFCCC